MADYADLLAAETKKQEEGKPIPSTQEKEHASLVQSITQSTKQITKGRKKRIINKPTDQSTSRLTNLPTNKYSRTVDRPKAFYITERLDKKLDDAVKYLQEEQGIKKADRSTIVNAILDNEAYWTEEALELLVDRVISQLTSRLTSK